MQKLALVMSLGLVAAACSGDDGNNLPIDAGPDAPVTGVCGTPAATLSTFPASHTGATIGGGHHLATTDGACADQQGWFGDVGEDQVVALTGLTPNAHYVLELATGEDLSVYVATSCDATGPAAGACLLHVDQEYTTEVGEFDAPANGEAYVIVDSPDDPNPPATGAYTLSVYTSECNDDAQCTAPGTGVCLNQRCVACSDDFDCTASASPVCNAEAHTCGGGNTACTGDDAGEPDDGPTAAHALAYPTTGAPTTVTAAACTPPGAERDWYAFNATAAGALRVGVTWPTTGTDFDFRIYNATGDLVVSGLSTEANSEVRIANLTSAGLYYLAINRYGPDGTAATPYTLTLALPECTDSFGCTAPATPVCEVGACVAGPSACTGDDAGEPDDGPASARTLNGAVGAAQMRNGAICSSPASELDWYRVDVATGEGLTAQLAWTTADDLDLAVFDHAGRLVGLGFWLTPEVVTLTYLPAGAYYLRVNVNSDDVPAAVAYTITATKTAAQTCASSTDCAAVYSNQIYRGSCTAGACQFIPTGTLADGMPCDSGDDCQSTMCSYSVFESDAQNSVCTHACTASTDCAGLGSAFRCTTGFQTNVCTTTCIRDLECGADTQSATVTSGEPWDYHTCTVATGSCGP